VQGLLDYRGFYLEVEGCVGCERRTLVYFNESALEFVVKDHVKTQKDEAHRVLIVVRLASLEQVRHVGLTCNHGFDDYIFDLGPKPLVYHSVFCALTAILLVHLLEDCGHTSFVAHIVNLSVVVEHKFFSVLVDGVVSQVHAEVPQIGAHRTLVRLCSESR